jgi:uncharacterized protein (TIGR03067 family)
MAAAVPAAARTCSRTDLDALQGSWVTVAGPREAKLLVAGNRFAVEFEDGTIYMGSFTLDPTDDPKRIDMRIEEGPAGHRGRTAYCIYHLDGGMLRWCPSRVGSEARLIRFPDVDDARYLSLVFRPFRPRRVG